MLPILKFILFVCLLNATLACNEDGSCGRGITVTTVINSDVFTCNGAATTGGGQTGTDAGNGETAGNGINVTSDILGELKLHLTPHESVFLAEVKCLVFFGF